MLIRLAQSSDLPALLALLSRVVPLMRASGNLQWDDAYPNREVFEQDIERGQLWVAEVEGQVAAVVAFTRDQEPEYAEVGWDPNEPAIVVHRLAVDPAHRGAGLARALMLHAEQVARAAGIRVIRLDTNTQNPATQQLLPKLGYAPAGEIGLSYRPGLRFLCYEKWLDHLAAIALGSNLASPFGDCEANLREAIQRIGALGRVRAVSSFQSTAPVGFADQPDFLNAALLLETSLAPLDLMRALLAIERAMGRDRTTAPPKGPRIIDLDLLLVDGVTLHQSATLTTPALTLPHLQMHTRRFVLAPLAEIAPEMIHPTSGLTIKELLARA